MPDFNTIRKNRIQQYTERMATTDIPYSAQIKQIQYHWAQLEPFIIQRTSESMQRYAPKNCDILILNEQNRHYTLRKI